MRTLLPAQPLNTRRAHFERLVCEGDLDALDIARMFLVTAEMTLLAQMYAEDATPAHRARIVRLLRGWQTPAALAVCDAHSRALAA